MHTLSRRRFITRTAILAAGLGLTPDLLAQKRRADQNSWVLMADTHIGENPLGVSGEVIMADHFRIACSEIAGLRNAPAGVIVAGDCVLKLGRAEDYRTLASLLKPLHALGTPVHLMFGNHDNRENFWSIFPRDAAQARPIKDKQARLVKTRRVHWLLLDSLDKTNSTPGVISEDQLSWLARELDRYPTRPAIVVAHHNPEGTSPVEGLINTEALMAVLRPRKQVKAYVYGHTHHWNVTLDQAGSGIHMINLPPVAYVFDKKDPSGWIHATLRKNGMILELRCNDVAHRLHGQKVALDWRRA